MKLRGIVEATGMKTKALALSLLVCVMALEAVLGMHRGLRPVAAKDIGRISHDPPGRRHVFIGLQALHSAATETD